MSSLAFKDVSIPDYQMDIKLLTERLLSNNKPS
jgi:hypothetical protein